MDKLILKNLIIENQEYLRETDMYIRDYDIEKKANYVFVGSRRAGKSYVMYGIAKQMLSKQITQKNILFINFEDERFIEFAAKDFNLILECYKELYNLKPILFFDEIQNIYGWEKFVRRLADKNFRVFVTGSNAKMLSKEIATVLGGRFLIKEIQTLSFKEFLRFNDVKLKDNYEFSSQKHEIKRLLSDYFLYGGFPEILNYENKREFMNNLYHKVLYGDIIARNNIKNKQSIRLLVKKMAESVNDETSFNRIKNLIKSAGIPIGTNTLIEYFDYLNDGFLLFDLQNYATKFSERETKKKFYFNDNGLLMLFFTEDNAKLLENLVYTELRRRYYENFYFYKKNYEVDFYVPKKQLLIQVSYTLQDDRTRTREVKSLKKIMEQLQIKVGLIITYDDKEETINYDDNEIKIIPLLKWIME